MRKILIIAVASLIFSACSEDSNSNNNNDITKTKKVTQTFSKTDNIESVRVTNAAGNQAFIVGSKSKRVYLASIEGDKMTFEPVFEPEGMTTDEELTNSAAINENIIALTHTLLEKNSAGESISCGGELILFDAQSKQKATVTVGSMPDAVGVSPNKKYIITADEHDSMADAWGKCSLNDVLPSISIVEMQEGIASAKLVKQIQFTRSILGPREPEYVAIASDNDTVAVTLQDSHEIAIFSIQDILSKSGDILDESVTKIVELPKNPAGNNPWPDGIVSFTVDQKIYFAMAGEWNDTIIIVDSEGKTVSNTYITEREVPTSFPCVDSNDSPRYSPDSITAYKRGGRQFIASTLKFAGAVIVYDVTNPALPVFQLVESVGETDKQGCDDSGSSVSPEGISAGSDYIWTANEGENSVTVIRL